MKLSEKMQYFVLRNDSIEVKHVDYAWKQLRWGLKTQLRGNHLGNMCACLSSLSCWYVCMGVCVCVGGVLCVEMWASKNLMSYPLDTDGQHVLFQVALPS